MPVAVGRVGAKSVAYISNRNTRLGRMEDLTMRCPRGGDGQATARASFGFVHDAGKDIAIVMTMGLDFRGGG